MVESIQSTREVIAPVLQRHYRIQTAVTYEQALRRARTTQFDGLVVGVNLCGIETGVEWLEELSAIEGYASVPTIVMIGLSLDKARDRLAEAGGNAFLEMPFVRPDLLAVLRAHLGDEHGPDT